MTAFQRGGRFVVATYSGDSGHSASHGVTGVTVALPMSTNGCAVFGHGRITAANGDQASFLGLAAAAPPRGLERYLDNGPAPPLQLVSKSVDAVTCSRDGGQASAFGRASLNGGSGSVDYRVDVKLEPWNRGRDTYRIRLGNGYDSGAEPIHHGHVKILLFNIQHHHDDPNAGVTTPGAVTDGG